jgi:hypothetical protein
MRAFATVTKRRNAPTAKVGPHVRDTPVSDRRHPLQTLGQFGPTEVNFGPKEHPRSFRRQGVDGHSPDGADSFIPPTE